MKIETARRLINYEGKDVLSIDKATTIDAGGLTITAGGLTITAGNLVQTVPNNVIADPGDGNTITPAAGVARNICNVTTAGAGETRVLGVPSFVGQILIVEHVTDGGDFTITITAGHKDGGASDDVATFAEAEDCEVLIACGSAATDWRFVSSAGVAFA